MGNKNANKYQRGRPKRGLNFKFQHYHQEFFQTVSAEREENLNNYYVNNEFYEKAISKDSKKAFFIGRTGSGKTAILERIKRETSRKIISINPEDFAFQIMERSTVLKKLTECKINLDLFYKTMWKYIFITELLKEIYGTERFNFLKEKIQKFFKKDKIAVRSYEFLLKNNELEEGLSFSEKIRKIIEKMEHSITAKVESCGMELKYQGKINTDLEKKIYDGLKEFEFSDLNYFLRHLDEEVLKNHQYIIIVDDLDKNWIQNDIGINFTRCLFETIFDIINSNHLRLLVSLRTNLFDQLNFSQSEKFLSYIDHIYWKDDKIKKIIEARFISIIKINLERDDIWNFIFPKEIIKDHSKKFDVLKYLLDRSNMRPRDVLIFISFAIEEAMGKKKITADNIKNAEKKYSKIG